MQSANSDPTVTSSTTPPDVEIAMAIAKAGVQMSGIKDINIHDGRMKRQISRGARRMCLACACASAIIIINASKLGHGAYVAFASILLGR